MIAGVAWDWTTRRTAAPGSDLWPVAWGADDNLYTAWGDGGGFGGTDQDGGVATGFARIEGMPDWDCHPKLCLANKFRCTTLPDPLFSSTRSPTAIFPRGTDASCHPLRVPVDIPLLLVSALGLGPRKNIADTDPRTPADEAKAFHLPPGFEIQLVASDPDIHKPLNMDFDDRGRLWVTPDRRVPVPRGPDGKLKGQDAVKILEDFGPDGQARKITTFADKLDIPIGVLPLPAPSRRTPCLQHPQHLAYARRRRRRRGRRTHSLYANTATKTRTA